MPQKRAAMPMLRLSIVVVSLSRPRDLRRCLLGISQQDLLEVEVVVVADAQALNELNALGPWSAQIKTACFETANISQARNIGIALAAGDVIAFIDDDAVPEPSWAARLLAAFTDPQVVAATGYVRGRNGISFQWRGGQIDTYAQERPLPERAQSNAPYVATADAGCAIITLGTNCAFRAADLRKIGGFDPAYRYYLDESDVNMRLKTHGRTAIVPMAEVHHGAQESMRRHRNRVPISLFEIGASTAIFLRRHAEPSALNRGFEHLCAVQRSRLCAHLTAGRLKLHDMHALLSDLHHGWEDGCARPLAPLPALAPSPPPFQALGITGPRKGCIIVAQHGAQTRAYKAAQEAVRAGEIVTVFDLSRSMRRHWHELSDAGYWLQRGGIWGRSLRDERAPFVKSRAARAVIEAERLSRTRPIA